MAWSIPILFLYLQTPECTRSFQSPDDVGKRSFCFMDAYIAEIERVTARNDTESSFYGTRGMSKDKHINTTAIFFST